MEVWIKGRPERKKRQLGYMIYYLPRVSAIKGYEKCPDQPRDADAVRVAEALGADAVIPLGRIDNRLEFRVIKFSAGKLRRYNGSHRRACSAGL
jgi:hypothetical protein